MKWKKWLAWVLVLSAVLGLTGCRDDTSSAAAIDLAIISGYHSNAPVPALQSDTVTGAIVNSTASYGSACVIVNDGAPYVAADFTIKAPAEALSATKRQEIAQEQAAQILSVLSQSVAVTPEVDTLASFTLAVRSLQGGQGKPYIVVMDSGLATAGYMDFTCNLLRADSQTIIDYLKETQALPDLTGISIIWVGLGDVAGIQTPLTPSALESLRRIWTDVLYAAGAESVEFSADLPAGGSAAEQTLPYVTPVEILQDTPIRIEAASLDFDTPLILDEKKILFLPDCAAFADGDAAAATLAPVADYMAAHPDFRLLIAGTTATAGSNEDCRALSRARAQAVEELLLSMGVDENQIAGTAGLGYDHKYHIPDLNADGSQNSNAPANRSVILFDADSAAAAELRADENT